MSPLASGTKRIKVAVTLFVVAMLLDSSLLVSASLSQRRRAPALGDKSGTAPLALLATPAGVRAFTDAQSFSANMSTRGVIMAFILTNPGVYLREIGADLGLSTGVVQYHIWALTKSGEVEECRSGRYRRFFGAARYGESERTVLSLLRQGTTGRILFALSGEPLTHKRLAALVGLTSQALSWHIKRLKETGVVEVTTSQGRWGRSYRLTDAVIDEVRAQAVPVGRAFPAVVEARKAT